MPQNKNALLRYRTIDRCLRNTGRRWTLDDLVDACSDALIEYEGKADMVSKRTVQLDLQMMRSDRYGYEAPIEVYERKFYRYADPDYTINNRPLSKHDVEVLDRTIDMLRQYDEFDRFHEMADVVNRLQDKVASTTENRRPLVDFERNPNLRGVEHLNLLYDYIASRQTIAVNYRSFNAQQPSEIIIFPYLLKEYRNRWFVFGSRPGDLQLYNLALDRIVDFHPCPDIEFQENPDFTPDFFDDVVGVTKKPGLEPEHVVILADKSQANYILTKPIHRSQRLVEQSLADGSMTFELKVVLNYELVAQLLTFGTGIRVLSPQILVDRMREIFRSGAQLYTISE